MAANTQVVLLLGMAGSAGVFKAGDTVTVSPAEAQRMVERGIAKLPPAPVKRRKRRSTKSE